MKIWGKGGGVIIVKGGVNEQLPKKLFFWRVDREFMERDSRHTEWFQISATLTNKF